MINGALFLNAALLFHFASSGLVTAITLFTIIYSSLESHKSDLSIGVLILIYLLKL